MGDYSPMFGIMFQVAGVVGRAETLSALFFLLSLFCYRRAAHLTLNQGWQNSCFVVSTFASVRAIKRAQKF